MEVHHHSHTPRKKWTHYFWEFLMLFLAVTLGFFVENQREHFIEHQREKDYARSLYDDFKVDTQNIKRTYDEKLWVVKKLDSLEAILSSGRIEENNELIYYFERFISRKDVFTSQDVTFKQLLSSGNFRYFRNAGLYKDISNYYNLNDRYFTLTEEGTITISNELSQLEAELFDPSDLNSLYAKEVENFYDVFSRPDRKFRSITNNRKLIDLLHIRVGNAKLESQTAALFLGWLGKAADSIVINLKKHYKLND